RGFGVPADLGDDALGDGTAFQAAAVVWQWHYGSFPIAVRRMARALPLAKAGLARRSECDLPCRSCEAQLSAGRHGRKLVDANEKGSAIIRLPFRDWPCPHKARPPLLAQQTTSQRPSCQQARAHID